MIRFELPSLGADMDEGTLLTWHVKPGDVVKRGQVLAVVDTSKAAVDVEIWHDGIVAELLVQPGEKIPVGTVLATLREPGEAGPAAAPAVPAATTAAATMPAAPAPAAVPRTMAPPAASLPAAPSTAAALRPPVSPAARKRARELDIDPESVPGTGPHDSVTIADVEAAARALGGPPAAAPARPAAAPVTVPATGTAATAAAAPGSAATAAPATGVAAASAATAAAERQQAMRKAIAAAMSRSKREIPHYYLSESVPMAVALGWLQQRNAGLPITERILPAAMMLKAVGLALRRTPELNGLFRDGRFQPSAAVHAGVAISLRGGGLVAPAIHDVGDKPLEQLMKDLADLVKRARAGSLRSSEMSDPTITVTNLGDQGVESVFGVIYPPQVALVGIGRVADRAWAQDGWIRSLPVVTATLAADHRVSDGHRGALFLAELRDLLQQPQSLAGGSP